MVEMSKYLKYPNFDDFSELSFGVLLEDTSWHFFEAIQFGDKRLPGTAHSAGPMSKYEWNTRR